MSDLFNRIEQLCKHRGITISKMCKESGAPRGSLTDLKSGRIATLSPGTLQSLADYFGMSIDELLGRAENGDQRLLQLVDVVRTRPEVQKLVEALSSASKAEVETAIRVINAIKTEHPV